jgi:C1A family cysteine protease
MPYNGDDYGWKTQPTAKQKNNAAKYKAKSWSKLTDGDYNAIKSQIASGNPVVIGIPVYPDFDSLDDSNPIYDNTDGTSRGNHAVCVVGYDDSKKAVKIINSWGISWGINGYGWISYDLIAKQNIEAYTMTEMIVVNSKLNSKII